MKKREALLSELAEIKKSPEGGRLLVNKPTGLSSFEVIKLLRKLIDSKEKLKIGHAGTLDPLAEGLLVVCFGEQTKKIPIIQEQEKEYLAYFSLGASTKSFDSEFPAEDFQDCAFVNQELIQKKIEEQFLGSIRQTPPSFSAVRVQKKRAYQFARQNQKVVLPDRQVEIYLFEILDYVSSQEIFSKIVCSKGTYIRSLINSLGQSLGVGAYLKKLIRTRIGEYQLKEAFSLVE